ncbi:MAG: DNA-directed RNA polymerase subunit omega [candidate division Zixibacteria bacterium]|nr:DNA-directed RNA polymerase subunit omega [candidate division Zixibacteria bacterium]
MDYSLRKKIEDATTNKYEAVIVASKLARKINNQRVSVEQQLGPDEPMPEHDQKVTTEALVELADGNVNYIIKEDTQPEEDAFPE